MTEFLIVPQIILQLFDSALHQIAGRWKCGGKVKGKGKAIPVEAWTDLEVSRRLRLPDFKTIGT